ncbi:MAG: NYN domain-containing protein [Nitrospirota bacterium]|nr:NYN domain-containing protein [Nitrospirota bacterium]
MAHILIDGYNLIGIAHADLEKARNDIIRSLAEYSSIKEHDITIVFDGWKNGLKDQTRSRTGRVTVIFTRLGDTADMVIRKMLASAEKPWIVVSSDREVYDFAAKKDFAAVTSDEFDNRLFRALRSGNADPVPDMDPDEDGSDPPARSGGNPNMLSKRQKKKLQALKKL